MGKLYERVNWEDKPSTKTPTSAANFNKMDKGIDDLDNKLVEQETKMESLASQVEQIANNQIPEEYLKASVDAYIDEKGAGLATDEDLTVLDTKIDEVNNQLTGEIVDYKGVLKNTYPRVIELYLNGLDNTKEYYVVAYQIFRAEWNATEVRVYESDSDNLISGWFIETLSGYSGLVELTERNGSGVNGYAVINVKSTDTSQDIHGVIDVSNVTDLTFNPRIKCAIHHDTISLINDKTFKHTCGVYARVNELYLNGLDKTKEYYVTAYQIIRELWKASEVRIYETNSNTLVASWFIETTEGYKGITKLSEKNNSGIWGYAVVEILPTDTVEIKATINNDIVSCVDYSPSVKTTILSSVQTVVNEHIDSDISVGDYTSRGSSVSELESSSIRNADSDYYVGFNTNKFRDKNIGKSKNVVVMNHDDLSVNDYLATRKIYNKYGFRANFNVLVNPFASVAEKETKIANVKRLIADGHGLGLHGFLNESFWWINKLFDVTPNSDFTFAPKLSEVKSNVFGYEITDNTKFSDVGFVEPPEDKNVLVKEATGSQYFELISFYCLYTSTYSVGGLDLNDNYVIKTILGWAEYWYNNLVDDTLGYSSTDTNVANKYAEDYLTPNGNPSNYYPDANHLTNGKIVFFDDYNNEHYSEAITSNMSGFNENSYQLVGRFSKGLFKGCCSTMNGEVQGRIIKLCKAFMKHYYGYDNFTSQGRHGQRFANLFWNNNGVPYADRGLKILENESAKFYHSLDKKLLSQYDVLLQNGIRATNHTNPQYPMFEGEIGMYLGQNDFRSPFFFHPNTDTGVTNAYLALFGNSKDETMDYETFIAYMGNKGDWFKYAYEMANKTIYDESGNSTTMYDSVKHAIDVIRGCMGTGKIPFFSYDTIRKNPATQVAIEMICRYCWINNIEIVPIEEARIIATNNAMEYKRNYFPNPNFTQGLIKLFDGYSDRNEAYMPNSWYGYNVDETCSYIVDTENGKRYLRFGSGNCENAVMQIRIYGLPSGKYKLQLQAKATNCNVSFWIKRNGDSVNFEAENVTKIWDSLSNDYTLLEYEFEIDEPYMIGENGTVTNTICEGYENNVSNIVIRLEANAKDSSITICEPKIIAI